MKTGERAFFYHSGEEKAVVGIVEVIKTAYPDHTAVLFGLSIERHRDDGYIPPSGLQAVRLQKYPSVDLTIRRQHHDRPGMRLEAAGQRLVHFNS